MRHVLEKSHVKKRCVTTRQNFLRVKEFVDPTDVINYPDGRSQFLVLPEYGEKFINDYLESFFEVALLYFIHSWHQKKGDEGLETGILTFFEKYDLEEYDFNILRVRRDYYRKLSSGYFKKAVQPKPVKMNAT